MRKKICLFSFLMLSVLMINCFGGEINAQNTFGIFTVQAVIPDNQVDKRQTYFDLRMSEDQQQTIQLVVRNTVDTPILAKVSLNEASTANNGLIVYDREGIRDESMELSILDIADFKDISVEIGANEEKEIDIPLHMPQVTYDGTVLGGFVVTAETLEDDMEETEEEQGFVIDNDYVYTIGIKVTQNDKEVEPELHLKDIKPGLVNYHTSFLITLQNSEALIMKNMYITASIYKDGNDEVLYQKELTNAQAAPNSLFDVVVDCMDDRIESGTYRLKMHAEYNDKSWDWDEVFEVTADDTSDVNDNAVFERTSYIRWILIAAGIIFIIACLVGAYRLGRRQKD